MQTTGCTGNACLLLWYNANQQYEAGLFAKLGRYIMAKTRTFVSFDYDHDSDLKTLLVGQAAHTDTPFEIADWSIKEPIDSNWKVKARARIKAVDVVCVLCGENTDTATGVSAELSIAQEEGIPYFLLAGYSDKTCKKPTSSKAGDKLYNWTWENLKNLIGGSR